MYYYSNFHNKNVSILFFHLPLITHYLAYSKWKVIFFTSPHGTITVILPTHKHYTNKKENLKSLITLRKSLENFQHQENKFVMSHKNRNAFNTRFKDKGNFDCLKVEEEALECK